MVGESLWGLWGVKGPPLKSGPFWPTHRPHLASWNEQRPLQAVLFSWLLITWPSACPTCVNENAILGKHSSLVLSLKTSPLSPSSMGWLNIFTTLLAKGPCGGGGDTHSSSVMGAELSVSPVHGRRGQTVPTKEWWPVTIQWGGRFSCLFSKLILKTVTKEKL